MRLSRLLLLVFCFGFLTATTATEADAGWPWGPSVYRWGGLSHGHWGLGAGWVPSVVPNIPSPNSFDVYPPPYYSYRGVGLSPLVGPAFGQSRYGYPAFGVSPLGAFGYGYTPLGYRPTGYSPYSYPAFQVARPQTNRRRAAPDPIATPEPEPEWIVNEFVEQEEVPAEESAAPVEEAEPAATDLPFIFEGSLPLES